MAQLIDSCFFSNTGKRISLTEKLKYDRRVMVLFQQNAWCDEEIMKIWVRQLWKPACQDGMLLVMDVHRAQTTDAITDLLQDKCNTDIKYVPGMLYQCFILYMQLMPDDYTYLNRWLYKLSSAIGCLRQ